MELRRTKRAGGLLVHSARVVTRLPSPLTCEAAACSFADHIIVVGLGKCSDEVWRFRLSGCAVHAGDATGSSGWTLCARLATGRKRHCVATLGRQLYVVGGVDICDESAVIDSVEVSLCLVSSITYPFHPCPYLRVPFPKLRLSVRIPCLRKNKVLRFRKFAVKCCSAGGSETEEEALS